MFCEQRHLRDNLLTHTPERVADKADEHGQHGLFKVARSDGAHDLCKTVEHLEPHLGRLVA